MEERNPALSVALAIAIGLIMIGCQSPEVDLRLNLAEGDVYRYQEITEQEMVIELQSFETSTTQSTDMTMQVAVASVNESGYSEIELTYERIISETVIPFSGVSRYDTADVSQDVPPEFQGLDKLIGQTVTLLMDPKGRVRAIAGYEELMQSFSAGLPADQEILGQMVQDIGGWYDENSTMGGITGIIGGYPDDPLSIGDSWERQTSTAPPLQMSINTVYTVTSIEGGFITIQVESEIEADMSEYISSMGLGEATFEMSGTQSGEIEIEIANGMLVRFSSESLLTATMNTYIEEFGGDTTIVYTVDQSFERRLLDDDG